MLDINKISKKIAKEQNIDIVTAESIVKGFEDTPPEFQKVIEAWTNDEKLPYEFKGITLKDIFERDKSTYLSAILTMSFLLKHPKYADDFLNRKMDVEDSE